MSSAINKLNSNNFVKDLANLKSKNILNEFSLEQLKAQDTIIISTKNSRYYFRVLDPLLKLGMLSGGSLGNKAHRAFLLSKENNKIHFLLENTHSDITHLFTSPIKTLKLSPGGS